MSNQGLNVTVDVGSLLAALRKSNPTMDLTGVKAYLLDMALAETDTDEAAYRHAEPAEPEPIATQPVAPEIAPPAAKPILSVPGIPDGVIGAAVERSAPSSRVTVKRGQKLPEDVKSAKERKRQEFAELASLSSKELLERLVPTGRRNEHGQVTDEGSEAPTGGGSELEIG